MTKLINTIRESWGWVGLDPDEIVLENDFGNLIIRDTSGTYWRLCPEDLYCRQIADSNSELEKLTSDPEFLHDWNMARLVKAAQNELGLLSEGQKYYLVIPGPLGGAYDVSNIRTLNLSELISLSGSIARQIEDVPDGAKIKIEFV